MFERFSEEEGKKYLQEYEAQDLIPYMDEEKILVKKNRDKNV